MTLSISLMLRRFLQPLQEDNASIGNLGAAILQKKSAICNGNSRTLHAAPTNQQTGKASFPHIRKPLRPIQTKRYQTCVVKDIFLHSAKPLKAVHGAKMATKTPLPPIRSRVTVPNNGPKKELFWLVRPEGNPLLMAYLKAKLISVTQELNLMKSGAKMDAQALEEKKAKEQFKAKVEKYT
ncbi:unnamed protein product [Coregonus sp. 'balchen']|nr:unnamed protein product [Coregonus sp. 'balchen']